MLMGYFANDWVVQAIFIIALTTCFIMTIVQRSIDNQMDAERNDKRARDLWGAQIKTGKSK